MIFLWKLVAIASSEHDRIDRHNSACDYDTIIVWVVEAAPKKKVTNKFNCFVIRAHDFGNCDLYNTKIHALIPGRCMKNDQMKFIIEFFFFLVYLPLFTFYGRKKRVVLTCRSMNSLGDFFFFCVSRSQKKVANVSHFYAWMRWQPLTTKHLVYVFIQWKVWTTKETVC